MGEKDSLNREYDRQDVEHDKEGKLFEAAGWKGLDAHHPFYNYVPDTSKIGSLITVARTKHDRPSGNGCTWWRAEGDVDLPTGAGDGARTVYQAQSRESTETATGKSGEWVVIKNEEPKQ
ncbi:MAG: hypothetical protein AAB337_03035 [Patescibacteria group bacterium]